MCFCFHLQYELVKTNKNIFFRNYWERGHGPLISFHIRRANSNYYTQVTNIMEMTQTIDLFLETETNVNGKQHRP